MKPLMVTLLLKYLIVGDKGTIDDHEQGLCRINYTGGRQSLQIEVFTPGRAMTDYLLNNPLGLTDGRSYLRLVKGTVIMLSSTNGTHSGPAGTYTLSYGHAMALEGLKTEEHDGKTVMTH